MFLSIRNQTGKQKLNVGGNSAWSVKETVAKFDLSQSHPRLLKVLCIPHTGMGTYRMQHVESRTKDSEIEYFNELESVNSLDALLTGP